ncbi:DNL-type zinc finger protein (Hsp70-escort protein 1) (HEP1) (mtHsp70-escort protein) [Durusdinium trenchii]|uniref:DNL-type zinc finger protein (Hsp70-escort protein 1) (HEP1) (MtHsp70-escort protein) n=1 Tax=Durusdinium trenchii TaxID=1381693 RepID=A0ABP0KBP0_9DINO
MWRLPARALRCRPRQRLLMRKHVPVTYSVEVPLVVSGLRYCSSQSERAETGDWSKIWDDEVKELEDVIRLELERAPDGLPGTRSKEAYAIAFTCNVCDGRSAKKISKRAYHHGVVVVTCPHCQNRHLIADRLGWFEEGGTDIEKLMQQKGEDIVKLGRYRLNCAPEDAQKVFQELVDVEGVEVQKSHEVE